MKNIDVNKVDYEVLEALIKACLADYSFSFNQKNPKFRIDLTMTLSPAEISTIDVLIRQGRFKTKQEALDAGVKDEKIQVRYLRVAKTHHKVEYHTPIIEEFKPGFVYQRVNPVDKVWEEVEYEEGDTPPTQDLLDEQKIRVAKVTKQGREIPVYQQSIRLNSNREVLNHKWWKRILYLDLLNTLMAKGLEYGEVIEVLKNSEEEKAVLAKELGDSAKEVLENNKIVIRKNMPAPLTPEDEKYKKDIQKLRDKEQKKSSK